MFKNILASLGLCALVQAQSCPVAGDASIVVMSGTSVGTDEVIDGVTTYITTPNASAPASDTIVLYLTDVYGINLTDNRLLADSFARAGFTTIMPDLFDGSPSPPNFNDPSFDSEAWLAVHTPTETEPIIDKTIDYMRSTYNFTKLAVTGYCFGGRYSFRYTDPARSRRADVAFAAHPSSWTAEDIGAIGAPTSVAAADGDALMPPASRAEMEALLLNISFPYQVNLYSGVDHSFAVSIDNTDPEQVFGKESAFLQAVRWFNYF